MADRDNILTHKEFLQTNRKRAKNKHRLFTWKQMAQKQIFLSQLISFLREDMEVKTIIANPLIFFFT